MVRKSSPQVRVRKYDHRKTEKRWLATWEKEKLYAAKEKSKKPKKYVLVEFPYPSGEGLHMGHLRPYVAGDTYSRFSRMKGFEVMYPIGWDAFGLPAENYAIKKGVHPSLTTAKNIKNATSQVKSWGISFDWAREVNTTDPAYYKWTQWIFLQFYKAGLAYEAKGLINWCPKDKTGLANEEVVGGRCERCGTTVEPREMRQWYLKITAYAEKLLQGLEKLEWPEPIKLQQKNWIGKKEGIEIRYDIEDDERQVTVFTTRPDTNFGATFVVLAPEHPFAREIATPGQKKKVEQYVESAAKKSEEDRIAEGRKKTGVFTGRYAINQLTGRRMPIWVGDFVLYGFGTGAVVGVPGHDVRDFEFAKEFDLDILRVVVGSDGDTSPIKEKSQVQEAEGTMVNSGFLDGLDIHEATARIMDHIEEKGWGKRVVQYHLRDWVFSRQRYWGEPIPLVHCPSCGIVPVPEKDLPVKLPPVKKYEPTGTGESPLASVKSWVNVRCPKCKGPAKRETNTMPQWAGSSWYYLRYADPKNKKQFASKELLKHWLPVDIYFGGLEHTTLHLLYSRFWHLFLYDRKLVPTREPYAKRVPHGIILGPDGEKMSKSRGNVVNPNELVAQFGADALRMYEMFLGPHEGTVGWNEKGILGVTRFLERLWKVMQRPAAAKSSEAATRALHRAVKKIGEDVENFRFNTAISALMILLNEVEGEPLDIRTRETLLKILAPFAPFIAEEIWRGVHGHRKSVHAEAWPDYDPKYVVEDTFTLVIQVNGKVRASLEAPRGVSESEARALALAEPRIKEMLGGKDPKRVIVVPGRLVNIVL